MSSHSPRSKTNEPLFKSIDAEPDKDVRSDLRILCYKALESIRKAKELIKSLDSMVQARKWNVPVPLFEMSKHIDKIPESITHMGRLKDAFRELERVGEVLPISEAAFRAAQASSTEENPVICKRCKIVPTELHCFYHPGNRHLDIESDVWKGMWEKISEGKWNGKGPDPEDPDVFERFAEGYKWDCCDLDGNTEGCETWMHGAERKWRRGTVRRRLGLILVKQADGYEVSFVPATIEET
ncbi:hypothetical protein TWF281_010958 [Arthrobotrys megalospora]